MSVPKWAKVAVGAAVLGGIVASLSGDDDEQLGSGPKPTPDDPLDPEGHEPEPPLPPEPEPPQGVVTPDPGDPDPPPTPEPDKLPLLF